MSLRPRDIHNDDEGGQRQRQRQLVQSTSFVLHSPKFSRQELLAVQIQFLNQEPWIVLDHSLEAFTCVSITWLHGRSQPEIQIIRNTSLQQAAYALHESFSLQKGWRFRFARKQTDQNLPFPLRGPQRPMPMEYWFTMEDPEIIQGATQTHILVVLAQKPGIPHNAPQWLQNPLQHMVSEIRECNRWEAQEKHMRQLPYADRWGRKEAQEKNMSQLPSADRQGRKRPWDEGDDYCQASKFSW